MTYRTHSFTLKYTAYRDYDRVYTLFTRDYGKLEVIARGSQKITSKLRGHLEPGILCEILIAQGKSRDVLCEAQGVSYKRRDPVYFAKRKIDRVSTLQKFLHDLDNLTPIRDKDISLFDLLNNFMFELFSSQTSSQIKRNYSDYYFEMMKRLGYG